MTLKSDFELNQDKRKKRATRNGKASGVVTNRSDRSHAGITLRNHNYGNHDKKMKPILKPKNKKKNDTVETPASKDIAD